MKHQYSDDSGFALFWLQPDTYRAHTERNMEDAWKNCVFSESASLALWPNIFLCPKLTVWYLCKIFSIIHFNTQIELWIWKFQFTLHTRYQKTFYVAKCGFFGLKFTVYDHNKQARILHIAIDGAFSSNIPGVV